MVKNIKRDEDIVVIFQSVLSQWPFEQNLEGNIDQLIQQMEFPKLIRIKTVIEITTLSVPTIYRLMKNDQFPKQIMVSERSARWNESEVLEYINKKIKSREES